MRRWVHPVCDRLIVFVLFAGTLSDVMAGGGARLTVIDLGHNGLSGTIPTDIGTKFPLLSTFDISGTDTQVSVPNNQVSGGYCSDIRSRSR